MNINEDSLIEDDSFSNDNNTVPNKEEDINELKDINKIRQIEHVNELYIKLHKEYQELIKESQMRQKEKAELKEEIDQIELKKKNKYRKLQYLSNLVSGNENCIQDLQIEPNDIPSYLPQSPIDGIKAISTSLKHLQDSFSYNGPSNQIKKENNLYSIRVTYLTNKIDYIFPNEISYTFENLLKDVSPILINEPIINDYDTLYFKEEKSDSLFPLHTPVIEAIEHNPSLSLILCDKSDILKEFDTRGNFNFKTKKSRMPIEEQLLTFLDKFDNEKKKKEDTTIGGLIKKKDASQKATKKNELIFKIEKNIGNKICYLFFYLIFIIYLVFFICNKTNTEFDFNINNLINSQFVNEKFKVPFILNDFDSYESIKNNYKRYTTELTFKDIYHFRLLEHWLYSVFFNKLGFFDKSFSFLSKHKLIGKIRFMQIRELFFGDGGYSILSTHPENYNKILRYISYDEFSSIDEAKEESEFVYVEDLKNQIYGNQSEYTYYTNCASNNYTICDWLNKGMNYTKLEHSFSFTGKVASYSVSSAFFFDLSIAEYSAKEINSFSHMISHFWIDPATRMFMISFAMYLSFNDVNTIMSVSIYFEIGKANLIFHTIEVDKYVPFINYMNFYDTSGSFSTKITTSIKIYWKEYFYLISLSIFCVLSIMKLIKEIHRDKSTVLYNEFCGFCIKLLSAVLMALNIVSRIIMIIIENSKIKKLSKNQWNEYINIKALIRGNSIIDVIQIIMVLFLIINTINAFYPEFFMRIFFTLQKGAKYLYALFLIFIIIIIGYSLSVKILFGTTSDDFSTVVNCITSMLSFIYSDYSKIYTLTNFSPVFAPIILFSFLIFIHFIFLNLMYIIIYTSYEHIKRKNVLTLLDFRVVGNGIKQFIINVLFKIMKITKLEALKDLIV